MSTPEPSLAIHNIALHRGELWLQYELFNQSGQTIWVFNLISDKYKLLSPPPRETVSPELAQTCHAGDGEVHFLQGIVPQPADPGVDYYGPIRPFCSQVRAHARYRVTFRSPLPLLEFSVYHDPVRKGDEVSPVQVTRARLSLDYVLDKEKFFANEVERFPGAFQVNGDPIRRVAATADLPEPQQLLARRGFPTFPVDGGPPKPPWGDGPPPGADTPPWDGPPPGM